MHMRLMVIVALGVSLAACQKHEANTVANNAAELTVQTTNSAEPATVANTDARVDANQIQIPDYPPLDADRAAPTGAAK